MSDLKNAESKNRRQRTQTSSCLNCMSTKERPKSKDVKFSESKIEEPQAKAKKLPETKSEISKIKNVMPLSSKGDDFMKSLQPKQEEQKNKEVKQVKDTKLDPESKIMNFMKKEQEVKISPEKKVFDQKVQVPVKKSADGRTEHQEKKAQHHEKRAEHQEKKPEIQEKRPDTKSRQIPSDDKLFKMIGERSAMYAKTRVVQGSYEFFPLTLPIH